MLSHWESIWGTSFALGFPRLGVTDAGFYALNLGTRDETPEAGFHPVVQNTLGLEVLLGPIKNLPSKYLVDRKYLEDGLDRLLPCVQSRSS